MNPTLTPASRLARLTILRTRSDEHLAELVGHGSAAAFEAIVHRYRRSLLRHCGRMLGDADAEEAVQDALLNAHAALKDGSEVRSLGAWLHAVAHNAAVGMLRRRAARPESPQQDCAALQELSPERGRDQLEELVSAVQSLPPRQRDAIVMRELEGRTYEEIGDRLGASDGAVRQLLNRARRSVRASLAALMPAGPLLKWALAAEDHGGVSRAFLGGGSAIAVKLTGAAVLSAVSMVTLLPAPHGAATSRRGSQHPARGGVSAPERVTAGSPLPAASPRLAVRPAAPGNVTFPAGSGARQHAGPTGGSAQSSRPGQMAGFRYRHAGDRASVGGRGGSGAASTGATGIQPAGFPMGSSERATGPTAASGQRSGAESPAAGPSGLYAPRAG